MKAAVGVLVRQDATPLPAVAGPSSSNEDDEERSVEWCLEAVKGDDEDAVVEALGIIGEALASEEDPKRLRYLARLLHSSGIVERLCVFVKLKGLPEVTTAALLVLGNLAAEDLDAQTAAAVKATVRATDGCLRSIVKQLFPPAKDDALLYALGALMNLVGTVRDATIVNEEDGMTRLIELSRCGEPQLEAFAVGTLQNLQTSLRSELQERDASKVFAKAYYHAAAIALQAACRGWLARRKWGPELRRIRKAKKLGRGKTPLLLKAPEPEPTTNDARNPLRKPLTEAAIPKILLRQQTQVERQIKKDEEKEQRAAEKEQKAAAKSQKKPGAVVPQFDPSNMGPANAQGVPKPSNWEELEAKARLESPTGRAMVRWGKAKAAETHELEGKPPPPPAKAMPTGHWGADAEKSAVAWNQLAMDVGWGAVMSEADEALLERPMLQLALLDALDARRKAEQESAALVDMLRGSLAAQKLAEDERSRLSEALQAQAGCDPQRAGREARARRYPQESGPSRLSPAFRPPHRCDARRRRPRKRPAARRSMQAHQNRPRRLRR